MTYKEIIWNSLSWIPLGSHSTALPTVLYSFLHGATAACLLVDIASHRIMIYTLVSRPRPYDLYVWMFKYSVL